MYQHSRPVKLARLPPPDSSKRRLPAKNMMKKAVFLNMRAVVC